MAHPERIQMEEASLGLPGLVLLGRYHTRRAQKPMELHVHPGCAEFVVVLKGREHYAAETGDVAVSGGEVFLARPNQPHGNGPVGQGISDFIWFQVRVVPTDGFLGLSAENAARILARLQSIQRQTWVTDAFCLNQLVRCVQAFHTEGEKSRGVASALFLLCLETLLMQAGREDPSTGDQGAISCASGPVSLPEHQEAIPRVLDHIAAHLGQPLELDALARVAGLSLSCFKRRFRQTVGQTPRDYVNQCLVGRAKEWLATGKSVTETAMALGFSGSDYFSVVFRRHTAMSPSEYRKSCRMETEGR